MNAKMDRDRHATAHQRPFLADLWCLVLVKFLVSRLSVGCRRGRGWAFAAKIRGRHHRRRTTRGDRGLCVHRAGHPPESVFAIRVAKSEGKDMTRVRASQLAASLALVAIVAASSAFAQTTKTRNQHGNGKFSGIASVYSYSASRTASGEHFRPAALTAAHRSLPFGSKVRVTNRHNGRSVVVRINDRGPFIRGRVIDVSPAAARVLGFSGLAPVDLTLVDG